MNEFIITCKVQSEDEWTIDKKSNMIDDMKSRLQGYHTKGIEGIKIAITSDDFKNDLRTFIEEAINRTSAENKSNTPDFVLAQYLIDCLTAYDKATNVRDKWYGVHLEPCNKYFEDGRLSDNKDCAVTPTATPKSPEGDFAQS